MKEENLNKIIEILEKNSSEEKGYFDLDYENIDDDEMVSCIRSNKDGLLLYAKELLIGFRKINESKNKINIIEINGGKWLGHDVKDTASIIKPIYKIREDIIASKPYQKNLKDKLSPYVFMLLTLLFAIGAIGGIFQLIYWIKN